MRPRTWLWAILAACGMLLPAFALAGGSAAGASGPSHGFDWWSENNTSAPNYTVTFKEVGLPAGTNWSVVVCITWWCGDDDGASFNTSNSSTITFSLTNGSYHYRVLRVNGNESNPDRGEFTVNGSSPAAMVVNFRPPAEYDVTFTETGLPSGTDWSVRLYPTSFSGGCGDQGGGGGWWENDRPVAQVSDGGGGFGHEHFFNTSNTSTITFEVTNGTYNYTVFNVTGFALLGAPSGSLNISGAAPATIGVVFSTLPVYAVTFFETGLPNGSNWSVFVVGSSDFGGPWGDGGGHHHHHSERERFGATSSTPDIVLNLTNGTYRYFVGWVDGYYSNDSRGSFVVAGEPTPTIAVNFTAIPEFNVSFSESGLPSGTDWGLTIAGVSGHHPGHRGVHISTEGAARGIVSFSLPSGRYHFRVLPLSGWAVTAGHGGHRLVVTDQSRTATISFAPSGHRASHAMAPASHGTAALVLESPRVLRARPAA
jgi:hypothetical protein